MERTSVVPETINPYLMNAGTTPLRQKVKIIEIARRPQVRLFDLLNEIGELREIYENCGTRGDEILEAAEITIKYEGYISREKQMADKMKRLEKIRLDEKFDYDRLKSISTEARQKLTRIRPRSIGQAARISGVSPSDISVLLIYMGR